MGNKIKQGKVQVYTGDGKGKTTAALGLALRAAGRGLRVYICQFMKGRETGESMAIERYLSTLITIKKCGGKKFIIDRKNPPQEEVARAREGLLEAREALVSGIYDVVILDEVNIAIYFNLLEEEKVLEFIRAKPENVELILTGRHAPRSIIEASDLVTEMREVKHYYKNGVPAREGIEF